MQPWQWNSLLPSFESAKKQTVNLKHHHTSSAISKPTLLYSSLICKEHCRYHFKMLTADTKTSNTNLPTQIPSDVWILTTPLAVPANTMTLICPKKAMETIIIQKPVHILKLPMACSATSSTSTYHLDMKSQFWM